MRPRTYVEEFEAAARGLQLIEAPVDEPTVEEMALEAQHGRARDRVLHGWALHGRALHGRALRRRAALVGGAQTLEVLVCATSRR